jgi:hypothetical protein
MKFLSSSSSSSSYVAAPAAPRRSWIYLSSAFPKQVTTTAPQTSRGFLAVGPDIAKIFAVAALCKASLSSV